MIFIYVVHSSYSNKSAKHFAELCKWFSNSDIKFHKTHWFWLRKYIEKQSLGCQFRLPGFVFQL